MEKYGGDGPEQFVLPESWYQKSYDPKTDIVVFAHCTYPNVELAVHDFLVVTNPRETLARLGELEARAAN